MRDFLRSDLERWRGTRKAFWMGKGNVCLETGGGDSEPSSLDRGSNLLVSESKAVTFGKVVGL